MAEPGKHLLLTGSLDLEVGETRYGGGMPQELETSINGGGVLARSWRLLPTGIVMEGQSPARQHAHTFGAWGSR